MIKTKAQIKQTISYYSKLWEPIEIWLIMNNLRFNEFKRLETMERNIPDNVFESLKLLYDHYNKLGKIPNIDASKYNDALPKPYKRKYRKPSKKR